MDKKQEPKKKLVTKVIKKTANNVSKSGDTTRTTYPRQVSKSGATSQLTEIKVTKRKKIN
jgi:hypothetical protein